MPGRSSGCSAKPCLFVSQSLTALRLASYSSGLAGTLSYADINSVTLDVGVRPAGRLREKRRDRNSARSADISNSAL